MKIAVIVPTIREEKLKDFLLSWSELFTKHNVWLYIVRDGENPTVNGESIKIARHQKSILWIFAFCVFTSNMLYYGNGIFT